MPFQSEADCSVALEVLEYAYCSILSVQALCTSFIYSNNKRLRPDDGLPAHQEAEEEKLLSENKLCVQTSRLTFERGAPPLSGVQSI